MIREIRDKVKQDIKALIDNAEIEDPGRGTSLWQEILGDIADDILAIPEILLKEKTDGWRKNDK